MFWALNENGEKVEPSPAKGGICPCCKMKVFSKCGEVNVWHWAHFKAENCDSWYEPETHWHFQWKMTFGKENTEVVIRKNDKRHIADVLTNEEVVIELQNSPIQRPIIKEREEFYGEKMLWLINGIKFQENFQIKDEDDGIRFINRHLPIISDKNSGNDMKYFNWNYPRKSWSEVRRHVFIDFGEDSLFWVGEGMGKSKGNGKYVPKEKFIKKYGGDFEYYCQQMNLRPNKKT